MVTGKILNIIMAFPSVSVEVAFSDDKNRLEDPTHLTYNIPIEQTSQLSEDTLEARVKEDALKFEELLSHIDNLQTMVSKEYINA